MTRQEGPLITAEGMLNALRRTIEEEVRVIGALVADEDSCCIARDLRAERVRAYEHVLSLIETARRWEW